MVQPGDTLRGIAARLYGDPAAYTGIARANAGRRMADGHTFDDPNLLRPGWQLDIPQPTRAVDERADGRWYSVQPGDTLTSIAARFLGDPTRWPEVFALNQPATGGAIAANPNLLHPGMQLRLPPPERSVAPAASSPTTQLGGLVPWLA
jgi:nucleoid-associated protein YgaU